MGNQIKILKGEEIHRAYDIKEKLGSGTFATVKRAVRRKDKLMFAIKEIKKSKLSQDELAVVHDEVEIMHKIEHPNCVHLYEMYETRKKVYMVLELLEGGELFERILAKGSFSEKEASDLMGDITAAIKYLHGIGIVHRDLKPENLLYSSKADDAIVKIADFGLAKLLSSTDMMATACGTPGYVAPEILEGKPYTEKVDNWSIGVILYILLCGFPPFYDENNAALFAQIKAGAFDFSSPYWDGVSESAKDLVRKLLTVDPTKRLTSAEILKHPWVAGGASSAPLNNVGAELKKFNARRKFRQGVRKVQALRMFAKLGKMKITGEDGEEGDEEDAAGAGHA